MTQRCKSLIPHNREACPFRYKYIILLFLNLHNESHLSTRSSMFLHICFLYIPLYSTSPTSCSYTPYSLLPSQWPPSLFLTLLITSWIILRQFSSDTFRDFTWLHHVCIQRLYITVSQRPSLTTLLQLTIIFSFFILIFLPNINHYDHLDICLM